MSKYRIYELAKEFDTTSKVIIDILSRNSITAKNHMSSVDDDAKVVIERTFARKTAENVAKPMVKEPVKQTVHPNNEVSAAHRTPNQPNRSYKQANSQPIYNQHRSQGQQPASQGQHGSQTRPHLKQQICIQTIPQWQHQHCSQSRPQGQQPYCSQTRPQGQQTHTNQQRPHGQQAYNNQQKPQGQYRSGQNQQTTQQRQQNTNMQNNHMRNQPQNGRNQARNNKFSGQHNKHQQSRQVNAAQQSMPKIEPPKPKVIKLGGPIAVNELASKLGREVGEVIKKLMLLGTMATINQEVDFDTASILAGEFGATVEELPPEEDPTEIPEIEDDPSTLVLRPPVVTVMGHVDHGKTSLLDAIRQTNVTAREAGGITQHIGAYQVMCQGKKIVFLDTPGHEAFTAMRARGAQVTDIAVLVVAADDGVMPQTVEAINHAKSAKVPIIVAINKMDRPGANPDRVKQQLAEYELVPEDWGGDTIMVPVSAHQKTGLNDLLEMILLVAEVQEIKANPKRDAVGTIIEAELDKGRGPVATVLVQKGTLRIGDSIIAGTAHGKVRAMVNDRGDKVKKAEPSTPVEVLGLSDVPQAGDVLVVVDEKTARTVAEKRIAKKRTDEMKESQKVSLDDLFKQIQEGNIKDLNIVVKADVQGSIEALRQALVSLKNKEVRVIVVHAGVGAINESDVMLAAASNALIIGFNVRPDANARKMAEAEKIDIRLYRVIYEAINDVEAAMTGMLAPEFKEVILGRVEVRKVITISKVIIAGAYVLEGKITNSSQVRVIRDGVVIHEGNLDSLRRFKDEVKEVAAGFECGISFEKFRDIKEGDVIEAFAMEEVKPTA